MKKANICVLALCLLGTSFRLFAGNGSVYSSFGVGEIVTYSSARTAAMGGTGIALLTDGYINSSNPAAFSLLTRTQYSADFQYQGYAMNDGTQSTFLSSGNIQSAMLAFPVYSKYKLAMGFGLTPFSQSAFNIRDEETEVGQDIIQNFDGGGGLSSAQVSFSFSPVQDFYLGATLHYIFGEFDYRQQLEYAGTGYFTTDEDSTTSMDGFGFTVGGAFAGIDKALGLSKEKRLNVAATLFTGATMDAKEERFENYITSRETTNVAYGNAKLPLGFAFGLEYQPNERLLFTGDAKFQQWGRYTYFGAHPSEIRNSSRFGIGAEFAPTVSLGESYFRQVSYRAGSYMNASYLTLNGEQIKEYFVTGGIGIPVFFAPGSEARLNIALEYGIRGTTSNGLQRDSITRLTISLSGSDTWFNPPEIE